MSMLRTCAVLVAIVVAAVLLTTPTHSFTPTDIEPNEAAFAQIVAKAAEISLVKVVGDRHLERANPSIEDPNTVFSFQTLERIKGNAPDAFTLEGNLTQYADSWLAQSNAAHNGIGGFWMHFERTPMRFPPLFAVGTAFLLFRGADGKVIDAFGRGAEPIASQDDLWLQAVRSLAREQRLKFTRKATYLDFIAASAFVVIRECKHHQRSITQIWGAPLKEEIFTHNSDWALANCGEDTRQLVVSTADGHVLVLDLFGTRQQIDLTGLSEGTEQGLSQAGRLRLGSLWYSQIELEGKRLWLLSDLKRTLQSMPARH
jgi:hypothetical protein